MKIKIPLLFTIVYFYANYIFGQFSTSTSNANLVYLTSSSARLGLGLTDPSLTSNYTGKLNIQGNLDFKAGNASIKGASIFDLTIQAGSAGSATDRLPLLSLVGATNCSSCIPGSVKIIAGDQFAGSSTYSSAPLEVGWNTISIGNNVDHAKLRTGNYKLGIAGKIIAEEMVVKLYANWPDFVFNEAYKLQPISDVENFIKKNKHLPGIPNESELKAKDGIAVSEMLTMQMQKIEELTLYLIEQNKQIKNLEIRLESAERSLKK